jgi:hypothetical protein
MLHDDDDSFGSNMDWGFLSQKVSSPAQSCCTKPQLKPGSARTNTPTSKPLPKVGTEASAPAGPKSAAEISRLFVLGKEAKQLLGEGLTARQYLELLIDKKHYLDATSFLAYLLPTREAVWWACLCVRSEAGDHPPAPITAAVDAAEKWVQQPNEDNRLAALPAAELARFGTPAGCAAVAVYWSGGSIAPAPVPPVAPAEYLTAHTVAGAIMLAAVISEPAKAFEKYRRFLAWGIEVADGARRWPEKQ